MMRSFRSRKPVNTMKIISFIALLLPIGLLAAPAHAAKTDIVVPLNGDHITGEVKELSYGQLKFKTDDMGTIYIEWNKIASLRTKQLLQVELADGRRVFGQAPEAGSTSASIRLLGGQSGNEAVPVELALSDVVRVATVDVGSWLDRLDGSFSMGYSFTQASDIQVFNLAADIGSRNRKRRWEVALDGQLTSQAAGTSSERGSLTSTLERFMPNRYYYETSLEFTRNEELGLDLRSLLGVTFGRYLSQRQGREWRAGAGLAASREYSSDGTTKESLEAQLNTSFRMFRFDSPETNLTANMTLLPSLTESGRLRGEGSIVLRHEVITDLFFEISLNDSYDNRPAAGFETNDWNVVTSLGYSF